jgi:hypothetical protein
MYDSASISCFEQIGAVALRCGREVGKNGFEELGVFGEAEKAFTRFIAFVTVQVGF